jgi:hypothetical protein
VEVQFALSASLTEPAHKNGRLRRSQVPPGCADRKLDKNLGRLNHFIRQSLSGGQRLQRHSAGSTDVFAQRTNDL